MNVLYGLGIAFWDTFPGMAEKNISTHLPYWLGKGQAL